VDWKRRYDLADRRSELHVRFLNLKADQDLVAFIRVWGPLWQTTPAQVITPISRYWSFQRRLKAGLALAQDARFNDAAGLKNAILEYVAATDEEHQLSPGGKAGEAGFTANALSGLHVRNIDVHPREWLPSASLSDLRNAAIFCLGGHSGFKLHVTWGDERLQFSWKPDLFILATAIELEVWNSLTGKRPVTLCDECGTAVVPESAHARRFCSTRCAHRVAMRMWRKRNPDKQLRRKGGKRAKTT
jgi:hypothetical protein